MGALIPWLQCGPDRLFVKQRNRIVRRIYDLGWVVKLGSCLGCRFCKKPTFTFRSNAMPTITEKDLEDYKKMRYNRKHGRLLAIDGLWLICDGFNRGSAAIGKHFLETLSRISLQINDNFAKFTSPVIEQEMEVILWQ